MNFFTFATLDEIFVVHRFSPEQIPDFPEQLFNASFYSITKTEDELSVVAPEAIKLMSDKREGNWKCLKVAGPLDFALTGILAEISKILAEAGISIYAISTFDTDYILIKIDDQEKARYTLTKNGHTFI